MTVTTPAPASSSTGVAERARAVRNAALRSVVVLFGAAFVLEAVLVVTTDSEPALLDSDLVRTLGGAALLVACLAQLVRLAATTLTHTEQLKHRDLTVLGVWAGSVCRATAAATLGCWLLIMTISFPVLPQESLRATGLTAVLAIASALTALVALASGAVWLVTEAVTGYREPRRR